MDKLPQAPTDTPEVHIPKRNPLMYQLVQRNSLWWDSCDSEVSLEFDEYLSFDDPRSSFMTTIEEGNSAKGAKSATSAKSANRWRQRSTLANYPSPVEREL